jgi:hypothetical protein
VTPTAIATAGRLKAAVACEVADLFLHDRETCDVARRSAVLGDAAGHLERDI